MAWGITCSLQKGGGKVKGRAVCPVPLQADYESGMGELTEIIAKYMKSLSEWENNVVILLNYMKIKAYRLYILITNILNIK